MLSANTSFVDFPRLCRLIAARRLSAATLRASWAAAWSTRSASAFLTVHGRPVADRLRRHHGSADPTVRRRRVPGVHALAGGYGGALAQAPEDSKEEEGRAGPWAKLAVNCLGTLATGGAGGDPGREVPGGAWITVLAFPILILLFRMVKRHYLWVARKIRTRKPLDLSHNEPPIVVVPTVGWNKLTDKALWFAMRLSTDVISIHLASLEGTDDDERSRTLRRQWAEDVEVPAPRPASLRPGWS